MTTWRSVVSYEGSYEVSNRGDVRSIDRIVWVKGHCHYRRFPGVLLKQMPIKSGMRYLSVDLQKNGKRTKFCVHTLVLTAFKGPRPPGKQARHMNGNIKDNRSSNLKWGTAKRNTADKHKHGTMLKGTSIHGCVLTEKKVLEIRKFYQNKEKSIRHLAKIYGVCIGNIYAIISRRSWKHIA